VKRTLETLLATTDLLSLLHIFEKILENLHKKLYDYVSSNNVLYD